MKKLVFIAVCLLSAMNMMAQNEANLSIADFEIQAGETKSISLNMTNSVDITAFECEIVLPEGMSIAKNKKGKLDVTLNEDRIDDQTLTVSQLESGAYKFLCYSNSNAPFYESSGEIVSIKVEAAETIKGGALTGTIGKMVLTTPEAVDYKPADFTFKVTATTAINQIKLSKDEPATIYDLRGNIVRKDATTTSGLNAGVYIINNKKVIVK